jgi:hypothetical protein
MSQSYGQYSGNPYGGGASYDQEQQGGHGGYNQSGNPYASTVSIALRGTP